VGPAGLEPATYGLKGRDRKSEIAADRENKPFRESRSPEIDPVERANAQRTPNGEPADADLISGILDALRLGLADVASSLSATLDDRRRARSGNVVDLDSHRRRR
jgi:hypothetical protein